MSAFAIPYHLEDHWDYKTGRAQGMCAAVHWSWVIPFAEWIAGRSCLEIMAGRGLLSFALQQLGVHVIPTDNFSWMEDGQYPLWHERFIHVKKLDCLTAIRQYGTSIEIMIMSWPPFNDPIAYKAVRELYKVNPEALVVYIGEDRNGHTADDQFFDHFRKVKDRAFRQVVDLYESYIGMNDYPHLGRYKP